MLRASRLIAPLRWAVLSVVALGGLALLAGPAASQNAAKKEDAKPDVKKEDPKKDAAPVPRRDFSATTVDGVRLKGDFYLPVVTQPNKNKRDAPCIILLHDLGGKRQDFGTLPEMLAREGYAVLAFDFRGHNTVNGSTGVDPIYWQMNPPKRPFPGNRAPTKMEHPRDFDARTIADYAKFGHDVMEAKLWLNKQSDAQDCNSNNICFIGAGQGAVVAMLYTAHGLAVGQDRRPDGSMQGKLVRGPRMRIDKKPEGEDVSCIISLSMRPYLGRENIERPTLQPVMEALREKLVGVLVLYGQKDERTHTFWNRAFKWIKPEEKKDQYERAALKAIEKTNLEGAKLLGQEALGTEDLIKKYLQRPKVLKDQPWQRKSEEELQQTLFWYERLPGLQ